MVFELDMRHLASSGIVRRCTRPYRYAFLTGTCPAYVPVLYSDTVQYLTGAFLPTISAISPVSSCAVQ